MKIRAGTRTLFPSSRIHRLPILLLLMGLLMCRLISGVSAQEAAADPAASPPAATEPAPAAPAPALATEPPAPAAPAPAAPAPAAPAGDTAVKAKLFYRDLEPKQLFQMLSDTYHIQFDEGADTIVEPITLISKGDQPVDLAGMLPLLNDVLSRENKTTLLDGQVVRIVPLLDTQTQRIPLQYADPQKVVGILRDLYLAKSTDKPELATGKVSFIGVHPQLQEILVRGPQKAITEIEGFVKTNIDIAPPQPVAPPQPPMQRHYIALDYMDADEFHKLIVSDDTLKDQFTSAIAPNNTLIVSSRVQDVFTKIDEMKKTFDVDRMEIRYLPLSNAQAPDVANLLGQIYPEQAPVLPVEIQRARKGMVRPDVSKEYLEATRQALAKAGVIDPDVENLLSRSISVIAKGELTIIPDTSRNALIIRTFSRNFPKILELIEKLDTPRDQVLIDVFITEVTLDNSTETGIDFTYVDPTNITHNATGTLRQNTDVTELTLGLNYQLVSDNITAYLHALKETDKLDIVTRPQVVTKDNTKAMIELGRRVPLVAKTIVSTEGAISSDVNYEDVTTRLEVTPQIHPDAYISLDIKQEINDVSTETFQISRDFNPQVLIKRQAQSQLRIKDGQTVCLGGFIGDNIQETERKVPLLGDIPILGYLFKYSMKSRVKTELIIFITPHILATPRDMLKMTNTQRRLSNSDNRQDNLENQAYQVLEPDRELRTPPFRADVPAAEISAPTPSIQENPEGKKN